MKIISTYKELSIQVKASMWFLVCSFLQKGISVISTPIFTRLLNTSEYGQYGIFNSWLSILTVFLTLQLYGGMYVRGMVKYSEDKEHFSASLQYLVLFLSVMWTIVYLIFKDRINRYTSLTTVQMLAMLIMIWSTAAFLFWAAEQRVELHYKKLVFITVITSIAKPSIGIVFVLNSNDKVTARILGLLLVEIVMYTGCFISQVKRGGKFNISRYWKEAFIFNIPLIPHYLSMSILNGADKIMIERMIGASEAGIYTLAYSLSQVMRIFVTALSNTVEPWLYKQIKAQNINDLGRVAYPSCIIIVIVNLILIAFAPEAVYLFAPKSYYDAIWIIPPVAMSEFFIYLYFFFAVFEFYYSRTKLIAIATCAGAVLNILLNAFFIKIFGYYAAGYTTLICYIIYAFMHYLFMRIICVKEIGNVKVYVGRIIVGISLVMLIGGVLFLFTYNWPFIRYTTILLMLITMFFLRRKILDMVREVVFVKKKEGIS